VMLFHAMMEFCLDLLRSKFWLIGEWSIEQMKCNNELKITAIPECDVVCLRYSCCDFEFTENLLSLTITNQN
jgi:hypothetical protein